MTIFIAILVLENTIYAQKNYYVSASKGDDSHSGLSLDDAWKTIQKAADVLQAGDTVFIASGIYKEHVVPKNSGHANNYITYISLPGGEVILDGTKFTNSGRYLDYSDRGIFDIKNKTHINVIGLTIRNSGKGSGIMCRYGSSYINIENNHVYNCGSSGIAAGYSRESHPLATNITAKGNLVEKCSLIGREAISFRSVINFEISGNIVRDIPIREGIDVKSGCANGVIYNNHVSNIGAVGIYVDAGYKDVLYESSHNIHVYNNICDNCHSSIAVASEGGCVGEDIRIYNNIVVNSTDGDGIIIADYGKSGSLKNIHIINNTVYNSNHRGIYINNLNVSDIYIRNNICSQNRISQIDVKSSLIDSVYVENNLIDGRTVDSGKFPVLGSPNFVNADEGDFHLLKTSPAIDKGTPIDAPNFDFDNIKRPIGNGYDIGAYEYPSAITPVDYKISCYPNPTNDVLFVRGHDILHIQVVSSIGQLIKSVETKDIITKVDLSHLIKGVYFIKVATSKGLVSKKIILQ